MNLENVLRKKEHCGLYIGFEPYLDFNPTFWSGVKKTCTMHFIFISLLLEFFTTHRCISINVGDFYFNKQGGKASSEDLA